MNKKAYELYPYVQDKWMLFQQPEGGYLRHHEGDETYLTGDIWDLTDLAVKIVLLCDGTNNVKDIIKNIHETCESTGFTPSLSAAKFLAEAKQNGILDFQDEPEKHLLTLKGSKERAYPMHFAIELTDACNLKCRHCYRESGPALSNRLPTEKLIDLLKEMQTNGVHSLELSGGEPTFHPDFLQILEFSLDHFGAVALLTNGTLLNKKIYDLLEKNKNKAIVQIDLDGCNAEEHEYLRGQPGCFDKAVKALKEMSERGIRVRVAMSIHSGNINSIEKTYQLAKSNGAKWFACSPILDIGRADNGMLLSWEEIQTSMKQINKLSEKDPETVLTASELKRLSGKLGSNCGAGSRSVALGPDGKIRPCFLVNTLIPSFKNVLESPLDEVIKQAPLSFYRNLEPPCPDLCGECKYTVFCYGCVARPLIAWDRMKQENKDFQCSWNTATGFRERIGLDA
ncbi:MAG: radical SAM protein [Bacteroidales bacterium]|nr:radical SAM protein [Bacteroidales bacterium]